MSVNWSKKEFASQLRKTRVFAPELRVGDIMFENDSPIGVAKVVKRRDKTIAVYDVDKNGWTFNSHSLIDILPRETLATRPVPQ